MSSAKNQKNKVFESSQKEDVFLDQKLRPLNFNEYIGQEHIKKNLLILLNAANERNHPPEHILFYGPPGLGKTTLANLISKHTGKQIKVTSGPAIERVGDLASILTNLESGDIFFIDEIHRLNKTVEEILYPAMESGVLDIIIGKGPSARSIQLELPPFTIIAATTRVSMISSPLRSRFSGGIHKLEFYTEREITEIVKRSAKILNVEIDEDASEEIAIRSRFTPRTANYLLKRCRDLAQVNKTKLDGKTVKETLNLLGIDEIGLTKADRDILNTIINKYGGGPVGASTLATSLSEEIGTIEEFHEPYLIQLGLIERTPRGRIVTEKAFKHLDIDMPEGFQEKLI